MGTIGRIVCVLGVILVGLGSLVSGANAQQHPILYQDPGSYDCQIWPELCGNQPGQYSGGCYTCVEDVVLTATGEYSSTSHCMSIYHVYRDKGQADCYQYDDETCIAWGPICFRISA